jgi:hypothetical protein
MDESKKINWMSVLLGAVITTAIGSIGTLTVNYLSRQEVSLQYIVNTTPQFFGSLANTAVYTLDVANTGKKEAKQLRGVVRFPGGNIEDHKLDAPAAMDHRERVSGDSFNISVPVVNPDDRFSISFVVKYKTSRPNTPSVDIRAEGESANPTSAFGDQSSTSISRLFGAALPIGALIISLGAFWWQTSTDRRQREVRRKREQERRDLEQKRKWEHQAQQADLEARALPTQEAAHVLAYLCFRYGLPTEGERLLESNNRVNYGSESDRLVALYSVRDAEADQLRRVRNVLIALLDYAKGYISPTSEEIVAFNIAKASVHLGDKAEAVKWLSQATKSQKNEVIQRRLAIEPELKQLL